MTAVDIGALAAAFWPHGKFFDQLSYWLEQPQNAKQ